MGFADTHTGIAATIFLGLYSMMMGYTLSILIRIGIKTMYTALFLFTVIRVAAQVCGVGFATEGIKNESWLIAYLVLGAEGYFALVLTCFHFVCQFQYARTGSSYLFDTKTDEEKDLMTSWERLKNHYSQPARLFHLALIPANAILIAGGSMTAGIPASEYSTSSKVRTGKIMRIVGQAVFLAMTQYMIFCALRVRFREKVKGYMITAVILTWPFLTVRGIYGIMSAVFPDFNYYNFSNYTMTGIDTRLLLAEYLMSTLMEFAAALLLCSVFLFKKDPRFFPVRASDDEAALNRADKNELSGAH